MAIKTNRVVIDTNLWISFLITKNHKKLDSKIKSGNVRLLFSLELLEEFLVVANRPKFKKYFEKGDLELLLDLFDVYGELVTVRTDIKICRDPKDNFILSLANDGKANFLVTGVTRICLRLRKLVELKLLGSPSS